jgi:hypothetical protein
VTGPGDRPGDLTGPGPGPPAAGDDGPEDPFTIGAIIAQQPERPPWYKRAWFVAGAAVAAVVIASVIVDLPSHTTVARDTADQTSIMQEINSAIGGCSFGVKETFTIYQGLTAKTLSAADRALTPSLLRDDQTACSFTSSSIYDLSNVEGTGTPAGKDVGNVVNVATLWATSDALGAIEDIQTLTTHPGDPTALSDLSKQEGALARDRATADRYVAEADHLLGARLPRPDLPPLPRLPGTDPSAGG